MAVFCIFLDNYCEYVTAGSVEVEEARIMFSAGSSFDKNNIIAAFENNKIKGFKILDAQEQKLVAKEVPH